MREGVCGTARGNAIILDMEGGWRSILVLRRALEGGPKNPPTGKAMKFLVAAFGAQLGVAAGS